jgi:two-component system cell cycle sensor histidine kinase/response regulator CckA
VTATSLERYRGHETILLVDDEPVVLNIARSVLKLCGYNVLMYSDPLSALADFRSQSVDLILTDVVMPGLSGPELVKNVKQARPDLPCVYMSGYERDQILSRGIDAGCDYIRKPFTAEILASRIRHTLDEKGTEQTSGF